MVLSEEKRTRAGDFCRRLPGVRSKGPTRAISYVVAKYIRGSANWHDHAVDWIDVQNGGLWFHSHTTADFFGADSLGADAVVVADGNHDCLFRGSRLRAKGF